MMTRETAFGAWALVFAIVGYMVACSTAQAAPYTLNFRNPGTTTYTSLRTPYGTVPVSCAPGATCSVVLEIPYGQRTITAEAADASPALWSSTSNALLSLIPPTPAECVALPACRHDADGDGIVSISDFGSFLGVLGRSWIPSPAPAP
jgi:hypothetical protein